MTSTLQYTPPKYLVDLPQEQRMARFEDGIYADLRSYLEQGHRAACVAMRDLTEFDCWELYLDEDAQATVRISVDGQPTVAVLPLSEVGRTVDTAIATGANEVRIGAPGPQPTLWFGVAFADGYCLVASDATGSDQLAAATDPNYDLEGGSFGDWLQRYAERSGVEQVNRRRKRAVEHLADEYPNESGRRLAAAIVSNIRYEVFADWVREGAQPMWSLSKLGKPISWPELGPAPTGTVADRIVHEISVEAYGASDPDLPTAQDWRLRYTSADVPEDGRRETNVVYEGDDVDALMGRSFGPAQVSSDWSIQHLAPDPTGVLVAGVLDLASPLRAALSDNLGSAVHVAQWRRAGLTDRQLAVKFADEIGATDVEIGNALKIARSTVRNTLLTANRKIRDFSGSE